MHTATLRRTVLVFGWLLWLLAVSPTVGAAPVLILTPNFNQQSLAEHIDLLDDDTTQLTYAQVASPPWVNAFRPVAPGELQQMTHAGTRWLRFALHNTEANSLLLILQVAPDAAAVTLYDSAAGKPLPAIAKPQSTQALYPLWLAADARAFYYLRLSPEHPQATQLTLFSVERFLRVQRTLSWTDNAGMGILLTLLVATLMAALLARDPLYLWLGGYGLCGLVAHSATWPQLIELSSRSYLVAAAQLFALACVLRLTVTYPAYPKAQHNWRRILNLCFGAAVIGAFALLLQLTRVSPKPSPDLTVWWIAGLQLLVLLVTIVAPLAAYLSNQQRAMLGFSLLRLWILAAGTGIAFTNGGFNQDRSSLGMLLLTEAIEMAGLLCLLSLRTLSQQALRQQQQRAIAAAAAEGRAHTEVIAEVGHRIRTPVSGVLGMLEMLKDTPLSATQRDYLSTIQRAGNELLNVVADLSDLSKLEALPGALQQTTFDPQALVAECVDGFRGLAGARKLELIGDPAPDLPAYVSGDPTRLRQILLQLLHHAVSHCEQGEIVVQVRSTTQQWLHFQIHTAAQAPQAAVSAMDRRLDASSSAGLRLGVARQLVDTLGGRMQLREQAAGKLIVWFELPLPAAVPMAATPSTPEPVLRNKQVLVVDDNATFCQVLRRQAGHWGMVVHTAASASEGLARLRNQVTLGQPIAALLLDADMQELADGDWLERLYTEFTVPPVVILLASRPEVADSQRLRQLGVRRVLLKPINHTSLKITLAEELSYTGPAPSNVRRFAQSALRCLVAEDNVINTKVLVGMLQKLGVDCTAVGNGQEAVEACQRQDYDIVLMDCDMPIMDGWEATRRIREIHNNRGRLPTPIIALTANTIAELGERARQPLMDAHLVKPIHLLELQALLERWTGRILHTQPAPDAGVAVVGEGAGTL